MQKKDFCLSIIIPCFNECKTIEKVVIAVMNSGIKNQEIIVIDDFSTDGTREILQNNLSSSINKVIFHNKNSGKGAAIRSGLKIATGDFIIIQDADLEYSPKEYKRLLVPMLENDADVVYGSRFRGSDPHRVVYFWHMIANRLLTFLSNIFTNINLTDMETCYKLFRKEILNGIEIKENRFGFEPEITAKIAKRNAKVYEVGISYHGRTYAEGKKIGWKDGFRAIIAIFKYNLMS